MNRRDKKLVLRRAAAMVREPDPYCRGVLEYRGCHTAIAHAYLEVYGLRDSEVYGRNDSRRLNEIVQLQDDFDKMLCPDGHYVSSFLSATHENAQHKELLLLLYAEMV